VKEDTPTALYGYTTSPCEHKERRERLESHSLPLNHTCKENPSSGEDRRRRDKEKTQHYLVGTHKRSSREEEILESHSLMPTQENREQVQMK
jgi:hypothetical protein